MMAASATGLYNEAWVAARVTRSDFFISVLLGISFGREDSGP